MGFGVANKFFSTTRMFYNRKGEESRREHFVFKTLSDVIRRSRIIGLDWHNFSTFGHGNVMVVTMS